MAASKHQVDIHMFKYENMTYSWTKCFERENRNGLAGTVKRFFQDFHNNHQQLMFTTAKIFDGSTQVLVNPEQYMQIKEELEGKIGETLPEVRKYGFSNGYEVLEQKSFGSLVEYKDYSANLERGNERIRRRQYKEAESQVAQLRNTIKQKPRNVFLAFDIEVYQQNLCTMLEIGFVKFGVHRDAPKEYFHYIISDNIHCVNEGAFNNRNNFRYGESQSLSLKEATARFQEHLATADILVTHSEANDVQYLSMQGIRLPEKKMFDTQVLARVLLQQHQRHRYLLSLPKMLCELHVNFDENEMHNAGNDAALTTTAFCGLIKKL